MTEDTSPGPDAAPPTAAPHTRRPARRNRRIADGTGAEPVSVHDLGNIGDPDQPHPDVAPGRAWSRLAAGNARYVKRALADPEIAARRAARAIRQAPLAAVFACSDARSAPERVFDCGPGEVFVVRTAGNVADDAVVASLEFAVWRLGTRLLVVMGHERCGAVAAALDRPELPNGALRRVVVSIRPAVEDLPTSLSEEERTRRGVRANVLRSVEDLLSRSELLRTAVRDGTLAIRPVVHDLVSGKVSVVRAPRAPRGDTDRTGGSRAARR